MTKQETLPKGVGLQNCYYSKHLVFNIYGTLTELMILGALLL